ncbi:MAG: extracellular solute-binding protein [Eubacteriales bacterium]
MKTVNVLAVGDPATYVYVDEKNKFIEKFQYRTGIKVNFDIIRWSDYYDTLLNSFLDYKYDIVMVAGHLWLQEFVDKGYLLPLKRNFKKGYDYEDIIPSIREEIEINGVNYLLPSFCDGHMLLYRKSQLDRELREVVSVEDIINTVKENYDKTKDTFVLKAHPSEIFLDFLPYLRNEGTDAFDKDGNPLFNNEKGYKALQKYCDMKKYCAEGVSNYGNEEVLDVIQKNKCKLGVTWGGQLGQVMNDKCIRPEDIEFSYLETSWNVTWSFGINAKCKDQESTEKFLEYITSKEVDKIVGAYCGNPTRRSSFIEGKNEYRWYSVLLKMLENAKPLPHLKNTGQLIGIITEEITKAFNNEQSPKEALKNANKKINTMEEGV